ncbi:S41 family peptidase [Pelomonas sp. SE-A7]|uniref:S41 family peptidase n=1 Tax=Pelomonas sp. SE-A7 TaxID=3054953 RepID=UPI00259CF9D8|nr:S41 family peptidase [Pelomonas sp. SE-A7]MDM4767794.1 S41 family peptidase [Pelomonas sp. SE-A7]
MRKAVLALATMLLWAASCGASPRLDEAARLVRAGQPAQARGLLESEIRDNGVNAANAWPLLKLHAAGGRSEAAFQLLSQLFNDKQQWLPPSWLEKNEALAALRSDARWAPMLDLARQREARQARGYAAAAIETPFREELPLAERLAGVSRIWSEAKYNFANFDLVPGLDWDALYLKTLEQVQKTPRTQDYYRELQRLVAALQDGHSNVYPPDELWDRSMARPGLRTQLIEGRVLVTELLDPALAGAGFKRGQELLAIDGRPVHEYAREQVRPFVSASTPQDLDVRQYGFDLLRGDSRQALRVTLRDSDDAKPRLLLLPRLTTEAYRALPKAPPFAWRMLPGDVALVELNGFDDDQAAEGYLKAFEQIRQARAIVFDLRANSGGNSSVGYRILATLADKPVPTSRWWTRSHVAAWRAWGRPMPVEGGHHGEVRPDEQRQFRGPVRVLTGAATYSAAEDFVAAFKSLGRGSVVGTATGGSTGQPLFFKLPGGGQARVCTKRDLLADGSEFIGKGLQPDQPVATTVAAWRAGRDEVLDEALAQLPR